MTWLLTRLGILYSPSHAAIGDPYRLAWPPFRWIRHRTNGKPVDWSRLPDSWS